MTTSQKSILKNLDRRLLQEDPLDGKKLVKSPLKGDLSNSGLKDQNANRNAAVLVPLLTYKNATSILFTQRPETMQEHPGQISFPGGRAAPGDLTPEKTALREAHEEIGLPPKAVNVVGMLPSYHTITRYRVTPIIGIIRDGFTPVLDPREVEDAFTAPVSFFLDRNNAKTKTVLRDGSKRTFYAFEYEDRFIWGATAAMLINLREALLVYAGEDR